MTQQQTWQSESPIPLNPEGTRAVRIVEICTQFERFACDKMSEISFLPSRLREMAVVLKVGDGPPQLHMVSPDQFPSRQEDQSLGRVFIAQAAGQLLREKLASHAAYQAGVRVEAQFNINDGGIARTLTING